jgi:alpha-aminoadipic semialdehyde synthase
MLQAFKKQEMTMKSMCLSLEGHLFDSGLINQILDVVEQRGSGLEFKECIFPPPSGKTTGKSSVVLKIDDADEGSLSYIEKKIQALVEVIEKADARIVRIDRPGHNAHATPSTKVEVESPRKQARLLLLGAVRSPVRLYDVNAYLTY